MSDLLTFEKLFTDANLAEYVKERKMEENVIDLLFPSVKTDERKFGNIMGANGLPVSASVHALDTSTQVASREGIKTQELEKVMIKRQIQVKEDLIMKLNNPRTSREYAQIKSKIFDDAGNMAKAVEVRAKAMAAEALHSGKIVFNENGIRNITVDYNKDARLNQTLIGTALWNDAGSDILQNIFDWINTLIDVSGGTPSRILTSRKVLATVLKNAGIRKAMFGVNADRVASLTDLNALMLSQDMPKFATFDDRYRVQKDDRTYETVRYIPENKVILLPDTAVGKSEWGPTPEEAELVGKTGIEAYADNHLTITVYRTPDPVAKWTKASGSNIPSFEKADEVFVGTVLA